MYKGLETTSIDSYIFDTLPYNEEINIEEIKNIESNLRDYISGHRKEGISYEEAFKFLDWVTFNARSFATRNIPESAITAPLTGCCAPTQNVNTRLLRDGIGLNAYPINMGDCVGDLPKNELDINRINNGFLPNNVRHAVTIVELPIQYEGITTNHKFLLDPTFRQFCLKENCDKKIYWNQERNNKGQIAPHPGYFLSEEYLRENNKSEEEIKKNTYVAKVLINRGYMELTEENAKIYGDAFAKSGTRWQFRGIEPSMTGKEYMQEFERNKVELSEISKDYDEYIKIPLERVEKETILDKIKRFFKRFMRKQNQIYLPESTENANKNIDKRRDFIEKYQASQYKYPNMKQSSSIKKQVEEREC